jgi:protein-S-isoprenylcysteine O-methyltransferase Ste14
MISSLSALITTTLGLILLVGAVVSALSRWNDIGWGAIVWLAAFLVSLAIRLPHSAYTRSNIIVEHHTGGVEQALLGGMFLTMMVLPLLHVATSIFAFADYELSESATVVGAVLQVPALWLFWRSHADLGRNWSPSLEVRENHGLITNGIYSRIRHPMYASIWLSAIAQPLLLHNWIAGLLVLPAFAAMWVVRTPREEEMMLRRFGEEYAAYMRRTGRVFPKLRSSGAGHADKTGQS